VIVANKDVSDSLDHAAVLRLPGIAPRSAICLPIAGKEVAVTFYGYQRLCQVADVRKCEKHYSARDSGGLGSTASRHFHQRH
jgi:hypothetical protein